MNKNRQKVLEHTKTKYMVFFKYLVFSFLWPFGGLWYALGHVKNKYSKHLFWFFCIYFGFVFIIPKVTANSADSSRIAAAFVELHKQPVSWHSLLEAFYNPAIMLTDIYQTLVSWIVSLFTGNPNILYAVFAAVFGFFYAHNLWIVLDRIKLRHNLIVIVFFTVFAFINPIWNINGVRMWTAGQIFIYGILLIFIEKKKKGLIWILITPLVHFSFLFGFLIVLIYKLVPSKIMLRATTLLFILYLIATFYSQISLLQVRNYLSFLPQVFLTKVNYYTNLYYAADINATVYHWQIIVAKYIIRYVTLLWVIILFLKRKKWMKNDHILNGLFNFGLFFGVFAQIVSNIPSGGRFLSFSNIIFYVIFILFLAKKNYGLKIKIAASLSIPFLLFYLIIVFRQGADFFGFFTLFGNPILALVIKNQLSLAHVVKAIF